MSGGRTAASDGGLGRFVPWLLAFCGALLTYSVASSGLVFPAYLVDLQVGLLAGVAAGLLADDIGPAAGCAAAGILVGNALGVSNVPPDVQALLILLASAAVTAAAVRWACVAVPSGRRWVVGVAVVVAVANLWATALTLAPGPAGIHADERAAEEVSARPSGGAIGSDDELYREIVWTMRDGKPYYESVALAWRKMQWGAPGSLFDVRQPTLFKLWASLPAWPISGLWAYLVFATLAMIAAPVVISRAGPKGAGVAGSAAIGAYLLAFTISKGVAGASVVPIFLAEPWVGALAVVVLAAYALAQDETRHRRWMVVSAVFALLAMISRELMLYLMLAGLAGAIAAPRSQRRFDLTVWLAALGAGLAYWGVHATRAAALITGTPRLGGFWMQNGGVDYLWKGITQFTPFVSPKVYVVVALVLLGIVGALLQPDRQYRVFATAAVMLPLVGFLFVGNTAMDTSAGGRFNYWGAIVLPALYALAPAALLLLPGLRRPATAQATEEEDEGAETQERMTAGA